MRPKLTISPENDVPFRAEVLARFPGSDTIADLEFGLRLTYPNARVIESAMDEDGRVTWTVYRDGDWGQGSG